MSPWETMTNSKRAVSESRKGLAGVTQSWGRYKKGAHLRDKSHVWILSWDLKIDSAAERERGYPALLQADKDKGKHSSLPGICKVHGLHIRSLVCSAVHQASNYSKEEWKRLYS